MSDILTLGYIEALLKSGRLELTIAREYSEGAPMFMDSPPNPVATLRFKRSDGSKVKVASQTLYKYPAGGGPY